MKKILLFAAMSAIVALYSCDKENDENQENNKDIIDGDWDSMDWEPKHTIYDNAYTIPANGDTIVFVCKNYAPWICASTSYEFKNNNHKQIEGECFSALVEDNTLTIVFSENTGAERSVEIDVTAGDIFDYFKFTQSGKSN